MNGRKFFYVTLSALLLLGLLMPSIDMGSAQAAVTAEVDATTDDEIVYLDVAGCVIVKDTNQLSPNHELITFNSNLAGDCGYTDLATGDFNNDGDAEIVAVGNFGGSGKLTIFDPVYRGADPEGTDPESNVPWKRIYTLSKSGSPITLVGAGNMNYNVPGDEIFIGYSVSEPNNINARIEVLIATNTNGTAWTTHINKSFGAAWDTVQVGNINGAGSDDVVLIRNIPVANGETNSLIEAHQIDSDFASIWSNGGTDRRWNSAAIGQVYAGGTGEVLAARQFPSYAPAATFFIFGYSNGTLKEADGDGLAFFPYPQYVFTADINGNGDDEAFFIRSLPSDASSVRLVMRNRGGDSLPAFELPLDADNGFFQGIGGDVDADGKDEVILLRSNILRIYQSPDSNQLYDDIPISTKSTGNRTDSLVSVANVDGTGYSAGARLTVTPDLIVHTLQAGLADSQWIQLDVTNSGTSGVIDFVISPPSASWILDFAYDSTATPSKLYIKFDATALTPGQYLGPRITLTTNTPNVLNPTVVIPIALNVTPAVFNVAPEAISRVYMPGQDTSVPISTTVTVNGTPGVNYSAGILSTSTLRTIQDSFGTAIVGGYADETGQLVLKDALGYVYKTGVAALGTDELSAASVSWPSGVAWAGALSADGVVSDVLTVGFYGDKLTPSHGSAVLVIVADAQAGDYPDNVRFIPIDLLKATSSLMLPSVTR